MKTSINDLMRANPGLGIARKSSILVAASGPYNAGVIRGIDRIPLAKFALAGAISSFYVTLTAVPQLAVESAADRRLGGRPTTPEQVAAHRRAILAGNAATIAAGLVVQRVINHSGRTGPLAAVGRVVSTQIAIGGAAGVVVMGSDVVLAGIRPRKDDRSPAALAVSALILSRQRRILRSFADKLTLPTAESAYTLVE